MTWLWLFIIASLIATWVSLHRMDVCFGIWICTSLIWTIVDIRQGVPAQVALQNCYILLSAYGLGRWTVEARADGRQARTG